MLVLLAVRLTIPPAPSAIDRLTLDDVLEPLALPPGPAVLALLPRLAAAVDGSAPVIPYAVGSPAPSLPPDLGTWPEGLAVVIGTSGSTGSAKRALLTAAALSASAAGTHEAVGGRGQWLLALPPHHIAGLQVLLRSLAAGRAPVVLDLAAGFDPTAFARAVARLDPDDRRYTSLVPAQLLRVLADPAATAAAATLDAVLVGGQALDPRLRARADTAGITVVATYGMTETAGGCVYDGRPLPGVRIAVEDTGRVLLGGPILASGYLSDPRGTAAAFHGQGIQRWFRTDDAGSLTPEGTLRVEGRLDDLINTGGLKVAPRLVEEAMAAAFPGIAEVCVVGVADPQWGQAVAAAMVSERGAVPIGLAPLRAGLRDQLPAHALPQRVRTVTSLPTRGPGKPDRTAVAALFDMGG